MRTLKTWLPVAVILVVLVAGYLISASARSSDSPATTSDETPESTTSRAAGTATKVANTGTPAVARTATPARTSAAATTTSAWGDTKPRDLTADESDGGHTLDRHVGRTDAQLRQRLVDEPEISAASTYSDATLARLAVGAALAKEQSAIRSWEGRTGERPNLTLRYHTPVVVGRSIERGSTKALDADDVVVVLRWSGKDWYVLTSYPEVR